MEFFTESTSTLAEAEDGTYKVVLITPGQGASAYYTEDLLSEQGPAAFPKGTHSYSGHPADPDKPMRDPEKLIGVLTEDAHYENGVGLVSRLKPIGDKWRNFLKEAREYIGMSVFVQGESRDGEVDGKTTKIAESLTPNIINTVDLVSYAGRGGHFAESLVMSALETSQESPGEPKETDTMALSDEKADALITRIDALIASHESLTESLKTKVDTLAENDDKADKAIAATVAVESADISDGMKQALIEGIKAGDYAVEGRIEEYKTIFSEAREAAKAEFLTESTFGSFSTARTPVKATEVEGW